MAFTAGLAVLGLTAALLAAWSCSRWGIGISFDSAHYVGAARSLAAGKGFRFNGAPFSHWPPLYPVLLAAAGITGLAPAEAARAFAILLYAGNTVLIAVGAYRLAARSAPAGIAAGALFLSSPEMLHIHTMAWSEPPFLLLALVTLLLLPKRDARSERWALAVAVCVAAAALTRFVGLALLPPCLLCLWGSPWQDLRKRAALAIGFTVAAAGSLGLWLLYERAAGHGAADRALVFHAPPMAALILPAAAIFAAVMAARQLRSEERGPQFLADLWLPAFLASYCTLVFVSMCFLDALTPLDARILSPVLIFGGLYLCAVIRPLFATRSRLLWRRAVLGVAAAAACVRSGAVVQLAKQGYDDGYGYSGRAWAGSPTLAWIDRLPSDTVLISNSPELIAYRTPRIARPLPRKYEPMSRIPNAALEEDTRELVRAVKRGALVVFFPANPHPYLLSSDDMEHKYGLPVRKRLPDAIIYGYGQ